MLSAWLVATLALSATDLPIDAPPIPSGAVALSEPGRYKTTRTFDDILDYYDKVFNQAGAVRYRSVVNLPGIKAKHIESLRKKTKWAGINVYETRGEVRLFIVPRDSKRDGKSDE